MSVYSVTCVTWPYRLYRTVYPLGYLILTHLINSYRASQPYVRPFQKITSDESSRGVGVQRAVAGTRSDLSLFADSGLFQKQNNNNNKSISQVKHFLSRNDTIPPPFFYNGSRKAQITHCKLSLGISDLNYDLLNRHLTTNSSCDCGQRKETSEHYILHCPRFTHVRQNTIFGLPANLLNITILLQGDPNISNNMNSLMFKAVQDFITQSGRFAME